ncbi:hypothetical protein C8Q79DRAFT_335164 [Trametes meyenii]|nr:hypothetical protein C8Q79DRAFT_335164 [Trametes meyenii]
MGKGVLPMTHPPAVRPGPQDTTNVYYRCQRCVRSRVIIELRSFSYLSRVLVWFSIVASKGLPGYAQSFSIQTPQAVKQCIPTLFRWSGGTSPYFLAIVPSTDHTIAGIQGFQGLNGNSMSWSVNKSAGSVLTLVLTDITGVNTNSSLFTIGDSGDSSCLSSGSSSTFSVDSASTATPPKGPIPPTSDKRSTAASATNSTTSATSSDRPNLTSINANIPHLTGSLSTQSSPLLTQSFTSIISSTEVPFNHRSALYSTTLTEAASTGTGPDAAPTAPETTPGATSTAPTIHERTSRSPGAGVIVGSAIGGFVLVTALVVVLYRWRRKAHTPRGQKGESGHVLQNLCRNKN